MDKQLKPHMDLAKDQGWEVTDDGAQLTLTHPEKGTVRIPARVSQGRALNNAEMTLRRGGVDISSLKPKKAIAATSRLGQRMDSIDGQVSLDVATLALALGDFGWPMENLTSNTMTERIAGTLNEVSRLVIKLVAESVKSEHDIHIRHNTDADIALEEAEKAEQRYLNEKKRADKLQADLDDKIADNGALLERARQAESRLETLRSALAAVNA